MKTSIKVNWERGIAQPAQLLSPYLDALGKQKNVVGLVKNWTGLENNLAFIHNGITDIYLDADEEKLLADLIIKEIEISGYFLKRYEIFCHLTCKNLITLSHKINKTRVSILNNEQLARIFQHYCQKYSDTFQTLIFSLWPVQKIIDDC